MKSRVWLSDKAKTKSKPKPTQSRIVFLSSTVFFKSVVWVLGGILQSCICDIIWMRIVPHRLIYLNTLSPVLFGKLPEPLGGRKQEGLTDWPHFLFSLFLLLGVDKIWSSSFLSTRLASFTCLPAFPTMIEYIPSGTLVKYTFPLCYHL